MDVVLHALHLTPLPLFLPLFRCITRLTLSLPFSLSHILEKDLSLLLLLHSLGMTLTAVNTTTCCRFYMLCCCLLLFLDVVVYGCFHCIHFSCFFHGMNHFGKEECNEGKGRRMRRERERESRGCETWMREKMSIYS